MSLLDDLISYWPLNEASGDALDAHGSNDLTDENTVGSATGIIGNARDFEASNTEAFSHADSADFDRGDTDFTGSVWVKLESKPANDMTILAKDELGVSDRQYRLQWDQGNDRFQWFVFDSSNNVAGSVLANTIGAPSLATWYHIVCWHSATDNEVGIIVNGTAADTSSTTAAVGTGSATFFIGRRDDVGSFKVPWDGLIDECGLWGRLLTSYEKSRLYGGGSGLAYDNFDRNTGAALLMQMIGQ